VVVPVAVASDWKAKVTLYTPVLLALRILYVMFVGVGIAVAVV